MPWTMSDAVRKTKKASTPAAKKQWTAVANKTLAKTGDDALSIKTANSVIKNRKKTRGPKSKTAE